MKPYQTVIDIIRHLAQEQSDRRSQDTYFNYDTNTPECIFGHALAILGARAHKNDFGCEVVNPEGARLIAGYAYASDVNWPRLGIENPTAAEAFWSDAVQKRQDSGATWGEAVRFSEGIL